MNEYHGLTADGIGPFFYRNAQKKNWHCAPGGKLNFFSSILYNKHKIPNLQEEQFRCSVRVRRMVKKSSPSWICVRAEPVSTSILGVKKKEKYDFEYHYWVFEIIIRCH